jgi:hypothetical protein
MKPASNLYRRKKDVDIEAMIEDECKRDETGNVAHWVRLARELFESGKNDEFSSSAA